VDLENGIVRLYSNADIGLEQLAGGRSRSVAISRIDDNQSGLAPINDVVLVRTQSPSRPRSPQRGNTESPHEPNSPVSTVGDLPSPRFHHFSPPLSPSGSGSDDHKVTFSPQPSPPMSPMSPYSPDVLSDKKHDGNTKKKIAPLKMKGKGTIKSTKPKKGKGKKEKKITDAFWWSSI
jgi:hypothetical protein